MAKPDYEGAHLSAAAAIIINDLDSLVHRIQGLEPHDRYTDALIAVQKAKEAMKAGRTAIHHARMKKRFEKMDQRRGASR